MATTISLLPSADLLPGAAGYPAYTQAVYAKLNEVATAMSVANFTPSTIAAGQGNPAADMTAAKNKLNEVIGVLNSIPSLPATFFSFSGGSTGFGLNVYDLACANYRFRSSAARAQFLTNAKSATLAIFNNMPVGDTDSGGLLLYDGATFVGSYKANTTVSLPGFGLRILTVVEGAHERPSDQGEAQGTSLLSITFPNGTTNSLLTPVASDTGLLVIGDSIVANGLGASMPSRYGPVPRLRDLLNYDVISDGWGYRSFGRSLGTTDLIEAQATRAVTALAPYSTRKILLGLSTNDSLLGYSTPTGAASICGQLLDSIHTKDASIQIIVQSMLYTTDYSQPILNTATARSSYCKALNGAGLAPNSSASHVHPNDSEYATYAANLATFISGGTVTDPNEPAKGEVIKALNSADTRLVEVGPFGFYDGRPDGDTSAPGEGSRYASASNASVKGRFTGTRLRLDFNLQPSGGMVELFIDGVSVGTFSQKAPGQVNVGGGYLISPVQASGSHTFELRKAVSNPGTNVFYSLLSVMDQGGTFSQY